MAITTHHITSHHISNMSLLIKKHSFGQQTTLPPRNTDNSPQKLVYKKIKNAASSSLSIDCFELHVIQRAIIALSHAGGRDGPKWQKMPRLDRVNVVLSLCAFFLDLIYFFRKPFEGLHSCDNRRLHCLCDSHSRCKLDFLVLSSIKEKCFTQQN